MSAFVAVLARTGAAPEVDATLLSRVAAPLSLYGPDGAGTHRERSVGLAHALLAARENARAGPHRSTRGAWLVGDLRLDGQAELREALTASGEAVHGDADDETLALAAWHAWGEESVARLRGDFSFALWDPDRRVLFCARDAFGVRPLYYADTRDAFVCSNVLAAVRAHPAVSARLHEPAIVSFLQYGWNVDLTTTTFNDVRRLAPAHQLLVEADASAATPRRHWTFPAPPPLVYRREEEYVEHYRSLLDDAVRDRLRWPRVGIFLSGGLDSTSLAATVRRVAPATEIAAYTTVASSLVPDDDGRLASEVARRLGVRHEIVDDVPVPLEHLADRAFRSPEPLDEPEQAAWGRLAPRIASWTPIAFMGEDGDALFQPPSLLATMRVWPPIDVLARVARYTVAHRRHPHLGLWLRRRLRAIGKPTEEPLASWVRRDVVARTGIPREPPVPRHPARAETQRFLLGTIWQSVLERCEPAWSGAALEIRWPLLDTRLLEFVLAIPPIPWCQKKELVRRAFKDELPAEVIRRPKTTLGGYPEAQVAKWRSARGSNGAALSARTADYVDVEVVRDHLTGGSTEQVVAAWRVLALDRWLGDL